MNQREVGGLEGVTFTAEDFELVRQWVQDRAVQAEIIATPTRLYLPVGKSGMVSVDADDTIWWDAEGSDNAFSLERA